MSWCGSPLGNGVGGPHEVRGIRPLRLRCSKNRCDSRPLGFTLLQVTACNSVNQCRKRFLSLQRGGCCIGVAAGVKYGFTQNLRCARRKTRPPHSPSHENPITQAGKGRTKDKRIPQPVAVLPARLTAPRGLPGCFMHTRFPYRVQSLFELTTRFPYGRPTISYAPTR